jgi:YfiH family protein
MPKPLTAPGLVDVPRVRHGFFTRHGGVSRGGYTSLNCGLGSRDDPAAVEANRTRVAAFLGASGLVTAHQVHSATAVVIDRPVGVEARPRADAIVTAAPGLAVGVLTADCAPVLYADAEAGVVGAAHAGWRGAIGGILEATVAAMEGLGARREHMRVVVGPAIGQAAYEVGPEFEAQFLAQDAGNARFFVRSGPGARPHFDLAGYAAQRLSRAGLGRVDKLPSCTYALAEDFFSYRRSTACKEPDYGRQISAIVLT